MTGREERERERKKKRKERKRKKKGKRNKTRERKIEEREARTGQSGTMADSLIDVGLGNGGEEIACLKVAERAWQENFPDKGEEKRAGAKSPGTKSLTFSPADRSYPPAPPRSSRSSFSPLPFHLAEYFRPRRISEKFNSEYSMEERKIYENVEEKKRRKRIVIVARIESEIIFESSSSKETERRTSFFYFFVFVFRGEGEGDRGVHE